MCDYDRAVHISVAVDMRTLLGGIILVPASMARWQHIEYLGLLSKGFECQMCLNAIDES